TSSAGSSPDKGRFRMKASANACPAGRVPAQERILQSRPKVTGDRILGHISFLTASAGAARPARTDPGAPRADVPLPDQSQADQREPGLVRVDDRHLVE